MHNSLKLPNFVKNMNVSVDGFGAHSTILDILFNSQCFTVQEETFKRMICKFDQDHKPTCHCSLGLIKLYPN